MYLLALHLSGHFMGVASLPFRERSFRSVGALCSVAIPHCLSGVDPALAFLLKEGAPLCDEVRILCCASKPALAPVAEGSSLPDVCASLAFCLSLGGASVLLQTVSHSFFAGLASKLDAFATARVQGNGSAAGIHDLVRCSPMGASGRRRRLDPEIAALASKRRNVCQAGCAGFLLSHTLRAARCPGTPTCPKAKIARAHQPTLIPVALHRNYSCA